MKVENRGGKREGAGRKPKADEIEFIKKLDNIIDEEEVLRGIQIGYVDIDNEHFEELVDLFNISSIPTLIFVGLDKTNAIEIKRIEGYDWDGFKMYIDSLVKKDY